MDYGFKRFLQNIHTCSTFVIVDELGISAKVINCMTAKEVIHVKGQSLAVV